MERLKSYINVWIETIKLKGQMIYEDIKMLYTKHQLKRCINVSIVPLLLTGYLV